MGGSGMNNKAAERLRDLATEHESPWDEGAWQAALADHAAAAKDEGDKAGYAEGYRHGERFGRSQERRATVERIREQVRLRDVRFASNAASHNFDAILDEGGGAMTTQTRNEAAERLRSILNANGAAPHLLDEALAAERRATVERIRAAWPEPDGERSTRILDAILDEEAAR
jgi:hypothetical protein